MCILKIRKRWHYRFMFHGKPYQRTTHLEATAANRAAAEEIEARRRMELIEATHGIRRIQARRFNDVVQEFLTWCEVEHRSRPATAERIRTSFASMQNFFGEEPVPLIDAGRIDGYKAWRAANKILDVTIRHDLHALSKFYRWAVTRNYARVNPVKQVTIPSDREAIREHVLTVTEERLYLQMAPDVLRDFAMLMLQQGCRPEELASLPKGCVDMDKSIMRIEDGKSRAARRTLHLTPESRAILGRRLAGKSAWIFPTPGRYRPVGKRRADTHIQRLNGTHERTLKRMHDATCPQRGECNEPECEHRPQFVLYDLAMERYASSIAAAATAGRPS